MRGDQEIEIPVVVQLEATQTSQLFYIVIGVSIAFTSTNS
ncbi:MAG: hypothetical protein QOH63_270 [Acidobacteriota bacterium]|jgi:hypothetical protein|nr:hypothetical protein [Acidobacteriota bacterium]